MEWYVVIKLGRKYTLESHTLSFKAEWKRFPIIHRNIRLYLNQILKVCFSHALDRWSDQEEISIDILC